MRAVTSPEPGVVEINWQWLPTFLGMNRELIQQIEQGVKDSIQGQDLTEENLDRFHDMIIDAIVALFPRIEGLRDFLDGLKYVRYMNDGEQATQA